MRNNALTSVVMLAAMALQGGVMLGMALFLHPAILLIVFTRSVPRAIAEPVLRSEIHPRIPTGIRATFLSFRSLVGRLAFSLSLLGTFLVRSGVITSVHAFATDPLRGSFILGFLAVIVGFSLLLFALRAPSVSARSTSALVPEVWTTK